MKIALYVNDKGGLKTYSNYLIESLKNNNIDVDIVNDFKKNAGIYHIQFESSLFHPFGLGIIPKIINLKLKGKKVILTMHTVLSRNNIYARNNFVKIIKRIVMPFSNYLICKVCDKIIVHRDFLKDILIKEYHVKKNKIEVIAHGAY